MYYIKNIDNKSIEENSSNYAKYGMFPLLAWFFHDFIEIREKLKILSVKRKRSNTKKIRRYKSSFSGPDMAIGIIAIILLGIKSFEKIDDKLHSERKLAELLGLKRFFDKTYARKFLGEFNLFHIKQLDKINTMILREYGDSFNQQIGILDFDLAIRTKESKKSLRTITEDNKIKLNNHYYIWNVCFVKEEVISQKLEHEKNNTFKNFVWLIEDVKAKLKLKRMIIRVNGEYISAENLNYCVEEGIQIISNVDWDHFFGINKGLDKNNLLWFSYKEEMNEKGANVINRIMLSDIGERPVYGECKYKLRALLVKIEKEVRTKDKKSIKNIKYVIIHNIQGLKGERACFEFYHQRHTMENIFEDGKNLLNNGKIISAKFRANEAYLNFVTLAYNLLTIFKKNICSIYGRDALVELLKI